MSTTICHISLNNNDLRKREISNRVLSLIEDTKCRIASQKGPKRGPRIPFEAEKGPFWPITLRGRFGLPGLNYRGGLND